MRSAATQTKWERRRSNGSSCIRLLHHVPVPKILSSLRMARVFRSKELLPSVRKAPWNYPFENNRQLWQFSVAFRREKFKFWKIHRSKCGCMVASCSSTNQIKGIESFIPILPEWIGLINRELRKSLPMKLTCVINVSVCDKINTHSCWLSPLHLLSNRRWSYL